VTHFHTRLLFLCLIITFITTKALAGQTDKFATQPQGTSHPYALVTMTNNVELHVEQIQLEESPGGQWITERPTRYASELYYKVRKDNVMLRRVTPFSQIININFSTFVASDAMYPEVRRMLIKLKDGQTIEWVHADRSITITAPNGEKKHWESFPWISGVVSSGEKEQGQEYAITGFKGTAVVNGEKGTWEAKPTEIKQIRFLNEEIKESKP